MTLDGSRHLRTLRNYQMMFRTSIGFASVGAVLSVIGFAVWVVTPGPMPQFLPLSWIIFTLASLLAYKVVTSTARLLDADGYYAQSGHR